MLKIHLQLSILLFLLSFCGTVSAQDKIYTVSGEMIDAKVTSVSAARLWYKQYSGPDSQLHAIRRSLIDRVVYADGTERSFNHARAAQQERDQTRPRRVYRPRSCQNLLSLNLPNCFFFGPYPGTSVGIGYERYTDRQGLFSVSLAIDRYWGGTYAAGQLRIGEERTNLQGLLTTPGLLFHPSGNSHQSDFSFGIVLPIGSIRRFDTRGLPSGRNDVSPTTNNTLAAVLGQINVTVRGNGFFVFCIQASGGTLISAGDTRGGVFRIALSFGGRF